MFAASGDRQGHVSGLAVVVAVVTCAVADLRCCR